MTDANGDVQDCVSCDGTAEVGNECWECHDNWRYLSIPTATCQETR
jgi:hypothetical protein